MEATQAVLKRPREAYKRLKTLVVNNERARARRVAFVKTVSDATRKVPAVKAPSKIGLWIPPTAFLPVSAGLASNVLCGFDRGMYEFLGGRKETLYEEFKECVEIVERTGAPIFDFFAGNELASTVASALVTKALSPRLTQTGRVVFVYGSRGSGKTTLVFWSLVSVLVTLGIPMERAFNVVNSLWITDIRDYLEIQKVASELAMNGDALPFVVIEDAGASISKYMALPIAPREQRMFAYTLSRMEQVAREGICTVIYVAHPESVIKGVRQMADLVVGGFFHDYPPRRHTIWIARSGAGVRDVFSTVHPTLRVPDELLKAWLGKKVEMRIKLVEELKDLLEKKEKERGEASERVRQSG